MTTASSNLLDIGSQADLIELFPMAAYAVRAPDGVIAWFNSRAAELWGRVPVVGDTDERFCGAYKLYHSDGTHMAHCDTPVALALKEESPYTSRKSSLKGRMEAALSFRCTLIPFATRTARSLVC